MTIASLLVFFYLSGALVTALFAAHALASFRDDDGRAALDTRSALVSVVFWPRFLGTYLESFTP